MKISRKLAQQLSQPWAIRAASMCAMIEAGAGFDGAFEEEDDDGEILEIEDGIATISISGVIGKRLPGWLKAFGMVDVDEVAAAVGLAAGDPSVTGILLDIDSPGGSVSGIPEAAASIRAVEKPIVAYSETLMASAAYWLASGAQAILSSESALVGSVGVFIPIADMSRMYEMAGIEMEVIKAGDLKAAGYPGTKLTEAQRAEFQASVNFIYGKFTSFIGARQGANGSPKPEVMQGQDFYGDQALEAALIDGISTKASAIDLLKKWPK